MGTEKTATTSLQHFFDHYRSEVLARGLTYTSAAGTANNWKLAVAAYDDSRRDDRSADAGVDEPGQREPFRKALVDGLGAELDQARSAGAKSVLFSSEHLHSRLNTATELERLAELLNKLGLDDITVVVYLRDPVALAASLHSTLVKYGSTHRHPSPPHTPYYRNLCDHRATVERWLGAFDSVVPRLFESETLINGSIVDDLLATIGLHRGPEMVDLEIEHLNRSLSRAELEVLSRINELVLSTNGNVGENKHPFVNPAQQRLAAAFERHSTGPAYQLPPALAAQYREAFADSNEWVRQRFFPGRDYLFAGERPENPVGLNPAGFDGLASLIAELGLTSNNSAADPA